MKRLYIITGKGGVGKTTISLSLARVLSTQNNTTLYASLDQQTNTFICKQQNIPFLSLSLTESIKTYLKRKFKSSIIAAWIIKTPFFLALFNIVPGLSSIIYLGQIINLLEEDPNLTVILDSPSSGHFLSILESPSIFQKIFLSGILVNDMSKIEEFLQDVEQTKIIITSLPTYLAINEAVELKEQILHISKNIPQIIINSSMNLTLDTRKDKLPTYLQQKINLEQKIINNNKQLIDHVLPFIPKENTGEIISSLSKVAKDLL